MIAALVKFRKTVGRNWKSRLKLAWRLGLSMDDVLVEIKDIVGPIRLQYIKLPKE